MGDKKTQGWIFLGVASLLLLAFFVYQYGDFKQHNWRMNLEHDNKEPYGLEVAKDIIEQAFSKDDFIVLDEKIDESLPEEEVVNSNYVFIGEALLLDTNDVDRLLDFIITGNTAFISSLDIPYLLMDEIFYSDCDSLYWEDYFTYYDTAVITNFVHPDLRAAKDFSFPYVYKNKIYNNYWQKIAENIFCDSTNYPIIISQSPDSIVDMVRFPYGDGTLYLQTSPIAFTNFFLTKDRGQEYAEKVFSHLADGPIYWDDFSNVPASLVNNTPDWPKQDPFDTKEGPLDYVLSQPPLAWAWYSLLAMAFLYIIFRAKRRQRMIPVLEKNRNTSLEFISTISRLHFTGDNHYRIAMQKMDLMESFIRSKYRLSFDEKDIEFTKNLSETAEIDEALIKKMFLLYTNIKSSRFTTDKTLIELHKLTYYFYKNCR